MYLVCRFKEDNSLFVTTRKSRELMINTLIELGQEIESTVEKDFKTYDEAMKYIKDIGNSDDLINKAIQP